MYHFRDYGMVSFQREIPPFHLYMTVNCMDYADTGSIAASIPSIRTLHTAFKISILFPTCSRFISMCTCGLFISKCAGNALRCCSPHKTKTIDCMLKDRIFYYITIMCLSIFLSCSKIRRRRKQDEPNQQKQNNSLFG